MSKQQIAKLWVCSLLVLSFPAGASINDTLHNLTPTGSGMIKEASATEVCVFCHTPHNVNPQQSLWNRSLPGTVYTLYDSSTLEAVLNQPTGSARLCLSCHDGTLALGNLRVKSRTGSTNLGHLTGNAVLGVDLSDDHPISFRYDAALALKRGELTSPQALSNRVRLDKNGQLQCTACHEPHDNRYRKFLSVDDRAGGLCITCHRKRDWGSSTHATSPAIWQGTGPNPWPHSPYTTVADNACENCHRPHSAPHPPRLLSSTQERDVCLVCHNGNVASHNLESEFLKASAHPIFAAEWSHKPGENLNTMPRHVACPDCHNPHATTDSLASPPLVSGRLQGVSGLTIAGGEVSQADYEYEVCLKCHGLRDETTLSIVRHDNSRNIRLKIDPNNPSYHPLAAVGKQADITGFEPTTGLSAGSMIYCTDCHNNDEWTASGINPKGPHGSQYTPLLERNFEMNDPNPESMQSYALCYKCHSRNSLITDQANTFPHAQHLGMTVSASCAVCHDSHGSREYKGLINFLRFDKLGTSVVTPSSSGRLEFVDLGSGRGSCYLTCHGKDHDPIEYP